MRVIPVMDVRDGNVVHAIGGDRSEYEPLVSDLCPTGEPLPLAFALKERFHFDECYLADLNAIAGGVADLELFAGLVELGLFPWVDAGIHNAAQAIRVRATGAAVVVGSELLRSMDDWEQIIRAVDPRRVALSLDLKNGRLLNEPLGETDPRRLVERLFAAADEIRATRSGEIIRARLGESWASARPRHRAARVRACTALLRLRDHRRWRHSQRHRY